MWSYIFVILASIMNAVMDKIQFHWSKSVFSKIKNKKILAWANPDGSWRNKWKNGNPDEGERFLGSSTVFVRFTDLWHFSQSFMFACFMAAIVLYSNYFSLWVIVDFIILRILFSGVFTIFFDYFFDLKFWNKFNKKTEE